MAGHLIITASCFAFCPLLAVQSGIINNNLFIYPVFMLRIFTVLELEGMFDWFKILLLTMNKINFITM